MQLHAGENGGTVERRGYAPKLVKYRGILHASRGEMAGGREISLSSYYAQEWVSEATGFVSAWIQSLLIAAEARVVSNKRPAAGSRSTYGRYGRRSEPGDGPDD